MTTGTGTVDVPKVGRVKSRNIVIGTVAVGGFVAFAYWQRSRLPGYPSGEVDPETTSLPDPTLPTVTTTPVPENTNVIRTNAEWTRAVIDYLSGQQQGWDAGFVSTVLGKFLARRGLTPNEESVALAALASWGQPPVGGPYNVISAPVSSAPTSPAPSTSTLPPGPYRAMTTDRYFRTVPRIALHFGLTSATVIRYNPEFATRGYDVHSLPIGIRVRLPK